MHITLGQTILQEFITLSIHPFSNYGKVNAEETKIFDITARHRQQTMELQLEKVVHGLHRDCIGVLANIPKNATNGNRSWIQVVSIRPMRKL